MAYQTFAPVQETLISRALFVVDTLANAMGWAQEMVRRCDSEAAAGRLIDGDAIQRIADRITQDRPDLG